MTLLSASQNAALTQHLQTLLSTCFPIMSHGACGAVAEDVVEMLLREILDCLSGTFAMYAKERNKLLAVARLPETLLHRVGRMLDTNELERAITVCTTWRASLLSPPELWKDVSMVVGWSAIQRPADLRTVLRRAENRPRRLSLRCWSLDDESPHVLALLRPAMLHLTTLSLDLPALEGSFWSTLLCSSAPLLERLQLRAASPNGPDAVTQKLPGNLFAGDAPRFTELVLSHVGLPTADCPALKTVTTLRLLKIKFLYLKDLENTFRRCPNLKHLLLDAISGQAGDITSLTPIPRLDSLRVAVMVWPGCLDLLARRIDNTVGQLHVVWPRPVCLEDALAQLRRPGYGELVVCWTRAMDDAGGPSGRLYLSLTARSEQGAAHGVHLVEYDRCARQIKASRGAMRQVRRLTVPDILWLSIVDGVDSPPRFEHLRRLTVHLAPAANVLNPGSYTHLFVLQQQPLSGLCPALGEVCLTRDPLRPGSCDFVRVVAVYVAQWLPSTVKHLILRGVKLIEPGVEGLRSQVESLDVQATDGDVDAAMEEMKRWAWN